MQLGLGYVRDKHDVTKDPVTSQRFGLTSDTPIQSDYSLEQFAVVNNQMTTESCVGWALKNSIDIHARAMGFQVPMDPETALETESPSAQTPSPQVGPSMGPLDPRSAMAIWIFGQLMGREEDMETAEQEPLGNVGIQPTLAVRGMMKNGVPSDKQWPFDPSKITADPTLLQIAMASAFRVRGYHRVLSTGPQRLADIRLAIQNNCPVFVGAQIDKAFMQYSGGVLAASDTNNLVGGHGTCLIGFRRDGTFQGLNQWSTGWGLNGLYLASADWILAPTMNDIIVVTGELVPQDDADPQEEAAA
jgi:hypothetical protein